MTVTGNVVSPSGTVGIGDHGSLTASGTISGQTGVTLSGDMTLSGLVISDAGVVEITDTGGLSLTNTSSIISASSIAISSPGALTQGGLLSAPRIVVNNGSATATGLDGTQIETSGTARPTGALLKTQLPTSTMSQSGFFMATGQVIQNGRLAVTGTSSIVRIDASNGVTLNGSGLVAPKTWFILGLNAGAKAAGTVDVLYLDTVTTGQAPGGGAALSGTVGGLGGDAAAGTSRIEPGSNAAFRINGCPIASVNCVLLTVQGIPAASPLNNFAIGSIFDPTDQDDLLLPLVSDEVY